MSWVYVGNACLMGASLLVFAVVFRGRVWGGGFKRP